MFFQHACSVHVYARKWQYTEPKYSNILFSLWHFDMYKSSYCQMLQLHCTFQLLSVISLSVIRVLLVNLVLKLVFKMSNRLSISKSFKLHNMHLFIDDSDILI